MKRYFNHIPYVFIHSAKSSVQIRRNSDLVVHDYLETCFYDTDKV